MISSRSLIIAAHAMDFNLTGEGVKPLKHCMRANLLQATIINAVNEANECEIDGIFNLRIHKDNEVY